MTTENRKSELEATRSRVAELRTKFQSYDGGDRPPSPPADLISDLAKAEADLEFLLDAVEDEEAS